MNVLVVDDNQINRFLLKELIKDECNVFETEDGIYSVDLVKENDYDIIFMDMMMPKMNGYEATKLIKEIKPHIPIYIVSAYKKIDFPADWQSIEYADILSKPVSKETIINIINSHKNKNND